MQSQDVHKMEVAKEVFEIKRRPTPLHMVRRSFPLYAPVYATLAASRSIIIVYDGDHDSLPLCTPLLE